MEDGFRESSKELSESKYKISVIFSTLWKNRKCIWFYLSALLATGALLFFVPWSLSLLLAVIIGAEPYLFMISMILFPFLFPFLYIYLLKIAKKKLFPNYFFWFLILISTGIIPLIFLVHELYFVIFGPCSDWCGISLIGTVPMTIIIFMSLLTIFSKSNKLS